MAWAAREGILARARWAPATIDAYRYRAAFREPSGDMLRFAQEAWGWRTTPGGLSLDPGASGLVRYHFDVDGPIGYARLEVWSQLPPGVNLAVEALPPAGKPVQLVCIG